MTRYVFILGHMLLHKLYINVAIANNLLYRFNAIILWEWEGAHDNART